MSADDDTAVHCGAPVPAAARLWGRTRILAFDDPPSPRPAHARTCLPTPPQDAAAPADAQESCTPARPAQRRNRRKHERRPAARALLPSSDEGARLLDVHEAAEMLGLQPATLYQWAYKRRIPRVKLSGPRGPLRFRLSDIRDVIARSAQPALRESGRDQSQWGRLS